MTVEVCRRPMDEADRLPIADAIGRGFRITDRMQRYGLIPLSLDRNRNRPEQDRYTHTYREGIAFHLSFSFQGLFAVEGRGALPHRLLSIRSVDNRQRSRTVYFAVRRCEGHCRCAMNGQPIGEYRYRSGV